MHAHLNEAKTDVANLVGYLACPGTKLAARTRLSLSEKALSLPHEPLRFLGLKKRFKASGM